LKVINLIMRISVWITMVVLVAMMMLSVADVFMRYVFNHPIDGTAEMVEIMMICLLLGMAGCAMENRHIRVDVIIERLPQRVVTLLDIITIIIGIGVSGILMWQGYWQGIFQLRYGVSSSMLRIPVFPFYIVLSVSFLLLIIAKVALVIKRSREFAKS
jgi:TRAP-type transport system small permease protein